MKYLFNLYDSLEFLFVNYFVAYIPCWHIRKLLYQIFRMKIARGARINMKVVVQKPRGIVLGERAIVNEFCHLDGRGGLVIENDASVSIYTKIITGSHEKASNDFRYISAPVKVGHHSWIGADAMILGGVEIAEGSVIAARTVVTKNTESYAIYAGSPAKKIGTRGNDALDYKICYTQFFR